MKNIILLGVPRSGKSTFAKMIMKTFPNYNLIQQDIIDSAHMKANEEQDRKENPDSNVARIVFNPSFCRLLLKNIFRYSVKYEPSLNFILDAGDISLREASKYDKNDPIVIVFGYPNITKEEALENILTHDTKDDWTYIEPAWRILEYLEFYIKDSKDYEVKCKKENIKFVDTSFHREQVLEELLEWLKDHIES